MAPRIFCNFCFQQPRPNCCSFALTNCGHVVCEACLKKGSMKKCCVCKADCRTLFLSDKMDPDLQALFTDSEKVCERYINEFTQIMEFQEKHKRHLRACEKQNHATLEAHVQQITERKEQMQRELVEKQNYIAQLENSLHHQRQQTARLSTSTSLREFVQSPLTKSAMYTAVPYSRPSSGEIRSHNMEVDPRPSPSEKCEMSVGPTRLSLISPPQDGRMGFVHYRGMTELGAFRSTPLSTPVQRIGLSGSLLAAVPGRRDTWDTSSYRNVPYCSIPASSLSRPPITIANLLMRP
uniref:RING-type domain-containing protein n=1 Tax=Callorhinchus milii TaxID=7868 RepID=A0A4W3I3B5_CALMI